MYNFLVGGVDMIVVYLYLMLMVRFYDVYMDIFFNLFNFIYV